MPLVGVVSSSTSPGERTIYGGVRAPSLALTLILIWSRVAIVVAICAIVEAPTPSASASAPAPSSPTAATWLNILSDLPRHAHITKYHVAQLTFQPSKLR